MSTNQQIIQRHDDYMIHNLPRYPIAIVEGEGCTLTDANGKKYLDLFSGFGAGVLGHCHPDLVAAATKQVNKLWHVGNLLHTEPQTLLAEQIASKGFGGMSYFCHSGSDANEAAFKLARLYGQEKRYKIIAAYNSFHGRGFAAMMATGQEKVRKGFAPYVAGFSHVPYNDLEAMTRAVDDETVAIVVEPIQGEGGVLVPTADYISGLRKLCNERDLLLIFDEVWTGCGRTGAYFAYQHWPVQPDIMTLGKAVGAGLAVGVMVAQPRIAEYFDYKNYGAVPHATTLGGNCVAMAVSARMFEVIERDNLLDHAEQMGEAIKSRLRTFSRKNPIVKEVRGKGLFLGIELDLEASGGRFMNGGEIVQKCLDEGLLINATQNVVLRLAPPLVIDEKQLDQALTILESVLKG